MKRGIVLISGGSPYYGSWAYNLAMGIRHSCRDLPITLLWKGGSKAFIEHYLSIFDKIIEIPDEYVNNNGFKSYLKAKTHLYELSPYDETIYIDADVMAHPYRCISNLFDELSECDITIGNRGMCDLSTDPRLIWAKLDSMREKFGDIKIWNLSSEFMYFKKTEKVKVFFEEAQKAFADPGIEYTRFAGTVPDELAFQIAIIKTGIEPHKEKFLPFYWEHFENKNITQQNFITSEWYGYSIGGNIVTASQKSIYDNLATIYAKGFGVRFPFLSYNKRELFDNRKHI